MMAENPILFKRYRKHCRRHTTAINKHSKGTYFFDYGNAFLLEASRAGADIMADNHIDFKYLSYVQDNPVF
jgi:urocanate hydratase